MIEGSYFDTPIVNLGIRQSGRESGNNIINVKNVSIQNIQNAIKKSLKSNSKEAISIFERFG